MTHKDFDLPNTDVLDENEVVVAEDQPKFKEEKVKKVKKVKQVPRETIEIVETREPAVALIKRDCSFTIGMPSRPDAYVTINLKKNQTVTDKKILKALLSTSADHELFYD